MACPSAAVFADLRDGRLSPAELRAIEGHLDVCEQCADHFSGAASVSAGKANTVPVAERRNDEPAPLQLGRYQLRRWLGRGGMGDVYEAFDPMLERKVAVKLLRERGPNAAATKRQLEREARTMARLSHPNLVAALDLGVFGERVFLVMELVEGPTVAAWLKAAPRTWREVLKVYLDAAEGLVAAHGLGVVHRDFKPQNVLMGPDGKARVSDFGLARLVSAQVASTTPAVAEGISADGSHGDMPEGRGEHSATATSTGAVIGTPRYMSPEQFLRQPLDHRTDQFSFCVALFEGLFGRHPFVDDGAHAATPPSEDRFRVAVLAGGKPATVTNGRVPRRVIAAILRGLSLDPRRRFPSFAALLAALRGAGLSRALILTGRPLAVTAITTVTVVLAAAGMLWRSGRSADPAPLALTGKPSPWTAGRVLLHTPDVIRCLMSLDSSTLRIIWGHDARTAEDVNIATGARRPADLLPETYRSGCPVLSPDGQHLIYEGFDAKNRPYIFHASNATGVGAEPLVSCSEPTYASHPRWLASSRDFVFDVNLQYPAVFSLDSGQSTIVADRDRVTGSITGFVKTVSHDGHRLGIVETTREGVTIVFVYRWPGLGLMKTLRTVGTLALTGTSGGIRR